MAISQRNTPVADRDLLEGLRRHLVPLSGGDADYDALVRMLAPARFALLGEASHGTHEFYRERIRITKRLILEHGFTAIALGKHGAGELNYSSDIDPILLYDPATLPRRERDEPAEAAQRYAREPRRTSAPGAAPPAGSRWWTSPGCR